MTSPAAIDRPPAPRRVCYRCFKAEVTCICRLIEPVDNRTGVTVLQHPKERFHSIGTVRIARLGLRNARVEGCAPWEDNHTVLARIPSDAALLYPSESAVALDDLCVDELPRNLVVIDGTWFQAKKIFEACDRLRELPAVTLSGMHSSYRIRREPRAGCLSTIEAIVAALRIIEPETAGLGGLLEAFAEMIDRQVILGKGGLRHHRAEAATGRCAPAAQRQ